MEPENVITFENAQILNIQEGDTIVLSHKERLQPDIIKYIHDTLFPKFKELGAKNMIILENEMKIEILRKDNKENIDKE